jgi:hypothetical protein
MAPSLHKNISKNALYDGFLDNPRPLYDSNMAKSGVGPKKEVTSTKIHF